MREEKERDNRDEDGVFARSMTRRQVARLGLGSVAALGGVGIISSLAACGGSSSSVNTSDISLADVQNASGNIKVLEWSYYDVAKPNPPGVKPSYGYLSVNEDTITKTGKAGSFDAAIIITGMLDSLIKTDRIASIDPATISNFDSIEANLKAPDLIKRDGANYAVPFSWTYSYLTYDKRQTTEPTSFDDLKSPNLKGKIGIGDDAYGVTTQMARMLGFPNPNKLTQDQFDQVYDALDSLRPQLRTIYDYGQAKDLMARQDIAIAFPEYASTWVDAKKAGADAAVSMLGAWSFLDAMVLYKGAKNPEAALKWMNFQLEPAVQRKIAAGAWQFPVVAAANDAVPKSLLAGMTVDEISQEAPLQTGVPIDDSEGFVTLQDWNERWSEFKI